MDGRFPFGNPPPPGGRSQFNTAAMRAALGLPPAGLDEAWYFQQAQQQQQHQQQQQARQQTAQQDIQSLQLRQLLLQEQLEQHVQDNKIRALGEQLQEYPDLQRHYQNLMLNEQLQRQRSGGLAASSFPASSVQQQAEFLREHASALRQHLTLRQYEELLRRQHTQPQLTNFRSDSFGTDSAAALFAQAQAKGQPQSSQVQAAADYVTQLAAAAAAQQQQQVQRQQQQDVATLAAKILASSPSQAMAASPGIQSPVAANPEDFSAVPARKQSLESVGPSNLDESYRKKRAKVTNPSLLRNEDESPSSYVDYDRESKTYSSSPSNESGSEQPYPGFPANHSLETFAYAADIAQPALFAKGTVEGLLQASEDCETLANAATVLVTKLATDDDWSESVSEEHDEVAQGMINVPGPAESVQTRSFQSSLPSLPEEPLLIDDDFDLQNFHACFGLPGEISQTNKDNKLKKRRNARTLPPLLEPVHAVDTWWPSMSGMRKERRGLGETSDEDNFEDDSDEETLFRVNKQKIRNRLARLVEPGLLEKLPHCKIHRIKCKGKKIPELVFCFQVTELYPNDVMVNCSICGTWRHAACGGHYKPYSTRDNTESPFVAVCENCHEEKNMVEDFPQSIPRLERQRQEQIRRAHATSAVMRHSSFSKHGGTYKWPLGSVSATHIGGHTRSVHVRHDKAEKQWSDMANRLNRGTGYRQKERVRSRTKELERLLVAIEDAESYTDRHNMLLFLLRDTAKDLPAGFEHELCNIFDPADDHLLRDECSALHRHFLGETKEKMDENENSAIIKNDEKGDDHQYDGEKPQTTGTCCRIGCERKQRFDSSFCSDACGLSTLEMDLLKTFQDASDIHPSVLRLA